jgi:drug/metabolite transporter (DMT)-like permease
MWTVEPAGRRTGWLTIAAAFAALYCVWGSTYLAIRIGLESLPPFLLAGGRFTLAGAVLYGWLRISGVPKPTDRQWWSAVLSGVLMLVCGVGGVTWAEQWVPSGIAALLVATVPLWMTVLDSFLFRRGRLSVREGAGMVIGLAGVVVLIAPSAADLVRVHVLGAGAILMGALCWSFGSLYSRRADLPPSPAMTVAVQMLGSGLVLLVVSSALREWQVGFSLSDVTSRSVAALVYLAVVGSIVVLCAYVWLLRRVPAPAVATYAFVNPVVALVLGWAVAGEEMGSRIVGASTLIVGAVILIQSRQWWRVPAADSSPCNLHAAPGTTAAAGPVAAGTPECSAVCTDPRR